MVIDLSKEHDTEKILVVKLDILAEVADPQAFPWNYADESIKEIACSGVFEYVPGRIRGQFMDEVYRVLIPNGTATFIVPYWNTARGIQDFRYEWPPLCEQSFLYFNKSWRETNKIDVPVMICDFDFTYGYAWEAETAARHEESRAFYTKRYTNCVDALQLVLTKRPREK